MAEGDRKMFAPLHRGAAVSPEGKLLAILELHEGGTTAATLAGELASAGLTVGARSPVAKRVGALLEELEEAGRVERVPDGRYRAMRKRSGRQDAS